jgi:hypothetical protein
MVIFVDHSIPRLSTCTQVLCNGETAQVGPRTYVSDFPGPERLTVSASLRSWELSRETCTSASSIGSIGF